MSITDFLIGENYLFGLILFAAVVICWWGWTVFTIKQTRIKRHIRDYKLYEKNDSNNGYFLIDEISTREFSNKSIYLTRLLNKGELELDETRKKIRYIYPNEEIINNFSITDEKI